MPPPRRKNAVGLGHAIINRKVKDAREKKESRNYTTDTDPTTRLQSVTQERDLDEFLKTAHLAGTDFTAEKQNIRVIQSPSIGLSSAHNPFLLTSQQEEETLQKHQTNKDRLRVPRRPPWTRSLTHAQLDRQERDAFLDWRRSLAMLSEQENFLLTPFERNIEVWRQLWRVLERSHLVVQIVDARNPLKFRCEDLERCIREIEGPEGEKGSGPGRRKPLLLVNKADLLTREQRKLWAAYFELEGIDFAFYSAATATAIQQREADALPVAELDGEELERSKGHYQAEKPPERNEGTRATVSDPYDNHDDSDASGEDQDDVQDSSYSEEGSHDVLLEDPDIHEDQDPSTRVLTVGELEELFMKSAPNLDEFKDSSGRPPSKLVVGLVGYPNVGKSSTINSLLGAKKVSVSSTPGKTKHFQTIDLSPTILLCDCPGLVFPQFSATKADLICDGVMPIDQMREYRGPVGLVTKRISKRVLEVVYGLSLRQRGLEEGGDGSDEVLAEDLLVAYAIARGFTRAGQGNPDESRAARYILKDYVNARILYCHPPPGIDGRQFNEHTMEILLRGAAGKKRAPLTRVPMKADTAPNILHAPSTGTTPTLLSTGPGASFKSQRLDRDFFDSQALSSRPLINGKGAGQAFSGRVKVYPHQNTVTNDGGEVSGRRARLAAVLEAAGGNVPRDGKKHFKVKRAKARSGKGYD